MDSAKRQTMSTPQSLVSTAPTCSFPRQILIVRQELLLSSVAELAG